MSFLSQLGDIQLCYRPGQLGIALPVVEKFNGMNGFVVLDTKITL